MRRKVLSGLAGLALFGCGSDPGYEHRANSQRVISGPQTSTLASPEVPRETVDALQVCVDRHAPGLSSESYAILYDIEATGTGGIIAVKIKDSMLAGSDMETCLTRTLAVMSIPAIAINMQHGVTPQSRGMVGIVQAAAAPIALLPIALVAGGVTILLGVTVHVIAHAIDDVKAEKERCKLVLEFCIAKCTEEAIPSGSPSGDPFFKCRRQCLEAAHCWGVRLY